jgi:hypothetical protein
MGLGLNYESGGDGGDIVPFVKYDARAGRLFRNDRAQDSGGNYSNTPVDITRSFKAVIDLENIEVGYIMFAAGSAPVYLLGKLGDPLPQKPADGKFKQGVRLMLKLSADNGGDVREITGNATAFLRGVDDLHTAYEAGKAENAGKLPVVVLKDTIAITSGSGEKKSTNYQPVFEIVSWAPRPKDLIHVPKAPGSAPAAATAAPTTGGTVVAPPAAKQPAPAGADSDFG